VLGGSHRAGSGLPPPSFGKYQRQASSCDLASVALNRSAEIHVRYRLVAFIGISLLLASL
jgi:hypothetical protein